MSYCHLCNGELYLDFMYYIVYMLFLNLLKSVPYYQYLLAHTDLSPQEPKNERMLLSGYGVELAIKNTEYKAVDDTQVKGIVLCQTAFCVTEWIG